MRMRVMAIAIGLSVFSGAASAQTLGLRAGSSGWGGDLAFGVSESFALRLGGSYATYSMNDLEASNSNVRYDAKIKLGGAFGLLDWHPFQGGFRISGGAAYNAYGVDLDARAVSGTITINGVTYSAADVGSLKGEVAFNKVSPYVGIGWGGAPKGSSRVFFNADLGVLWAKPKASLTGTCGSAVPAPTCAQLQNDVQAERIKLQAEADKYDILPVVSVGIGLRF